MPTIDDHFATRIYQARIAGKSGEQLREDLHRACLAVAGADSAGQDWCRANAYAGYTSYASLDDLPWRDPVIGALVTRLDAHVAEFARALDYDLGGKKLTLDSLWINCLDPGGMHAGHVHPGSVISGTYYVALPEGAAGLKFEDPRLALMMAAPPRRPSGSLRSRRFVEVLPKPGTILLWESFVRHEVPPSGAKSERVSISFNYR